jgi:hypothetical protein
MDRRANNVQYLDPAVQAQHQTTHDVMAPRRFPRHAMSLKFLAKKGWICMDMCFPDGFLQMAIIPL